MYVRAALLSFVLLLPSGWVSPCRAAPVPGSAPALTRDVRTTRDDRVDRLLVRAEERLAVRTIEARRMAIADLERASEMAPRRADVQLALARAYYQAGFLVQSRRRFERVMALAPEDAQARFGLGQAWRRDWLKYLERPSLDRAVEHYSAAARLDPSHVESWLLLSALQVERADLAGARAAADHALQADRARAEGMLAAASTRWRQGEVTGADSLFRLAISRLRRSVRERFEDIAPLATERDTMQYNQLSARGRSEYARRFWAEHDPDLATAENEAQLEYWARVAQAYFLYFDPVRREWDERGEVYVRYGPPDSAMYNPIVSEPHGSMNIGNPGGFPVNVLVWSYSQLGMTVRMHDRMLSERYELPRSLDEDLDPEPSADSLRHLDVMATHGLRGVFPSLPPGARPLKVSSQVAMFEGATSGQRLFAGVSAPGDPADTLVAELVVLDTAMHEIVRTRRTLSPSACDAAGLRVAEFDAELAPGDYTLGASVRGGGRRGAIRGPLHVAVPDSVLGVSDLVVTCGLPPSPVTSVRLAANPSASVRADEPLVAYFEVYHLTVGPNGQGRFEYETAVRSATRDKRVWLQRLLSPRREGQSLGVTRQDAVLGTVRRQYVSLPVQSLPPGRWRLEVTVRDVLAGLEQRTSAEFTRE
jgi:GWxTD domain-containing protein